MVRMSIVDDDGSESGREYSLTCLRPPLDLWWGSKMTILKIAEDDTKVGSPACPKMIKKGGAGSPEDDKRTNAPMTGDCGGRGVRT